MLPNLPKGFDIETAWDTTVTLNPLGVYVTAITLMYGLSLQPWSATVELVESGLVVITKAPAYDVVILTSDTTVGADLTTELCVQALYRAVNDMAVRQPGFYQSTNYIVEGPGIPIGRILITDINHPSVNSATNSSDGVLLDMTIATFDGQTNTLTNRTLNNRNPTTNADSGQLIDPDNPSFKIFYQYTGKTILAGDLFSAALDGLASVAQYNNKGICDSITALSVKRNVVFHVGRSTAEVQVLAGILAKAFFLLVRDLFLVQKRFQEMEFGMEVAGMMIADGYILKFPQSGVGNVTNLVTSE